MNHEDYTQGILFGLGLAQRAIIDILDSTPTTVETRTILYTLRDNLTRQATILIHKPAPIALETEDTPAKS